MIYFPNAKINIGLHVKSRRPDGFHNIETLYCPVGLSDILEVIPCIEGGADQNSIQVSGLRIDAGPSDNLCLLAWQEFNREHTIPGVKIHLHKIIPAGAGLGGGSSDAAFCLKAFNDMAGPGLSDEELSSVAGRIGSDCPFFIHNRPLFAAGRGDLFELSDTDLSGFEIVIVHPGIHVSTAWAYNTVKYTDHPLSLKEIMNSDPRTWQGNIVNDFEQEVFKVFPVIGDIKDQLLNRGAVYASMTGSGSAVYGLFEKGTVNPGLGEEFPGMFFWAGATGV